MEEEELDKIYAELFKRAQEVLDKHNPCQFDSEGSCFAMREDGALTTCCGDGCANLGAEGCLTRNLACKLFLCFYVRYETVEGKAAWEELEEVWKDVENSLKLFRATFNPYYLSESNLKDKLVQIQSALK